MEGILIQKYALIGTKFDFCSSPIPSIIVGRLEPKDMRIFFENAVYDLPERPGSFAVNDPDMVDSLAAALPQILRHEILHISGMECVQIQHTIDRNLYRIIFCHLF